MEKLEETVKTYNSKLVVVSDVAGFFLDNDVPQEEAERIYSQIASYLANFARKHQIILIATYLPYQNSKRNNLLHDVTCKNASTVLSFTKTAYAREVNLEKHSCFTLGKAELPSENLTLTHFMGANNEKTVDLPSEKSAGQC